MPPEIITNQKNNPDFQLPFGSIIVTIVCRMPTEESPNRRGRLIVALAELAIDPADADDAMCHELWSDVVDCMLQQADGKLQ
jgi:hypothetical protein